MIEIDNITKSFEDAKVLHGISWKFEKGKTNMIIGASGTGKSVLLKCIVGLINPDEVTDANLKALNAKYPEKSEWVIIEKHILGFNKTLAREVIHRGEIITQVKDLFDRFSKAEKGYLYKVAGKLEVYPFKLSFFDQQPEKFKTLSMAVMLLTDLKQTQTEEVDEEKTVLQTVIKEI